MCGVNGFNFADQGLIERMNEKIKYRGPDDQGVFIDKGISLGHNRLSIIDLSSSGHQPMISKDGNYIITYNGELYNFQEIKKDLLDKGYNFFSNTDTEVILNAYIAYGESCLQKFNGIFALAIWDKKRNKLFAARDHFGIKPFFYYFKNGKFIFSSEIKAILEHKIEKDLDFDALNLYFRFLYISAPLTMFKHIKKLSAGNYLILEKGKLFIKNYYQLPEIANYSYDQAKKTIREKFDAAVKRQLISDRPLGLFLSGGVDSTAILGSMSKIVSHKIKTFTVKFDIDLEEEKFNADSQLARKNSQYYQTEHYELLVSAKDVAENIEKVVYQMDELVSNHTQVATYLLSKEAKKQVDVVLGGDGGDELFGGYQRYYFYNLVDSWQKLPKIIRENKLAESLARSLNKEKEYKKLNAQSGLDLFWQFSAQKEEMVKRFLKADINNLSKSREIINQRHFGRPFKNYADYLMRVDLSTWLTDESFAKSDKLSMAFALEQRVPFLDKELVDLAFSIPAKYKLGTKEQGKRIFKEAVREYLPDYLYNKPKTGWFSPAAKWLRTGLKETAYEILSPDYNPDTRDFFDFDEIKLILDNHMEKKEYALNTIWSLITFQIWYKLFK
ncbi:MAG: asparagine synthase (glutamine-hydrolyzing) [Patescibacteria group bacterium]|nr:asparagine synthase (glutamine-hydrolyzing) [Patescibacteria group bacterium]